MFRDRAWATALAEHETVIADCAARVRAVPAGRWHARRASGTWSPAEETLHVVLAYELGHAVATGQSPGMRRRVSPLQAALSRWVLLPALVRLRAFPRGAAAPPEVWPSTDAALRLTPEAAATRLARAARDAARSLRAADSGPRRVRVVHAYFGALPPLATLRLLSAHTRHHAARLATRGRTD